MKTMERSFRGATFKHLAAESAEPTHASWFTFEDEQEVRDKWWHIQPGDVVIDGGAGFGSYALPALALGASRVHIFSPEEADTDLLLKNIYENPGFIDRSCIYRRGLHGRPGWFEPNRCAFAEMAKPADGTWIEVTTLDDFFESGAGLTRLDWLKLDVEGAELHVLRAAEKLLRRFSPKVLVENHLMHDRNIEGDVRQLLGRLGYQSETRPHHAISHSFFWI